MIANEFHGLAAYLDEQLEKTELNISACEDQIKMLRDEISKSKEIRKELKYYQKTVKLKAESLEFSKN